MQNNTIYPLSSLSSQENKNPGLISNYINPKTEDAFIQGRNSQPIGCSYIHN